MLLRDNLAVNNVYVTPPSVARIGSDLPLELACRFEKRPLLYVSSSDGVAAVDSATGDAVSGVTSVRQQL